MYRIKKKWSSRFDDDAYVNSWGEKTDHFGAERFSTREEAENALRNRTFRGNLDPWDYEIES